MSREDNIDKRVKVNSVGANRTDLPQNDGKQNFINQIEERKEAAQNLSKNLHSTMPLLNGTTNKYNHNYIFIKQYHQEQLMKSKGGIVKNKLERPVARLPYENILLIMLFIMGIIRVFD